MNNDIVEILPNLWLSSRKYALNKKFLKKKNIKLIINCTKTIDFIDLKNISKVRVNINDSLKDEDIDKLTDLLPKIIEIIEKFYLNLNPILVHCYAGKQRSATIIAGFIMKTTSLSIKQCIAFIQSKKKNAFRPGINFLKSLETLNYNLSQNKIT
jgi:protein-tyrosine phosphatase